MQCRPGVLPERLIPLCHDVLALDIKILGFFRILLFRCRDIFCHLFCQRQFPVFHHLEGNALGSQVLYQHSPFGIAHTEIFHLELLPSLADAVHRFLMVQFDFVGGFFRRGRIVHLQGDALPHSVLHLPQHIGFRLGCPFCSGPPPFFLFFRVDLPATPAAFSASARLRTAGSSEVTEVGCFYRCLFAPGFNGTAARCIADTPSGLPGPVKQLVKPCQCGLHGTADDVDDLPSPIRQRVIGHVRKIGNHIADGVPDVFRHGRDGVPYGTCRVPGGICEIIEQIDGTGHKGFDRLTQQNTKSGQNIDYIGCNRSYGIDGVGKRFCNLRSLLFTDAQHIQ